MYLKEISLKTVAWMSLVRIRSKCCEYRNKSWVA